MLGTIINVVGILIGGIVGLTHPKPFSRANESYLRVALSAFIVYYGLRLTWMSLGGSFLQIGKQLVIVVLSLALGRLVGQLCHIQDFSNSIGRKARTCLESVRADSPTRGSDGFNMCAALFCAAPLGVLGAVQEGVTTPPYFYPLAVKAAIDGLAAMGFASLFGPAVLGAALPVLAFQGSITLVCARFLQPVLAGNDLVQSVTAVGGLLIFCVALLMLDLRKIKLADYLPSLLMAPLVTWVWR
jgi:uncharacterized membrane protein YqgA involved in biofilm formation